MCSMGCTLHTSHKAGKNQRAAITVRINQNWPFHSTYIYWEKNAVAVFAPASPTLCSSQVYSLEHSYRSRHPTSHPILILKCVRWARLAPRSLFLISFPTERNHCFWKKYDWFKPEALQIQDGSRTLCYIRKKENAKKKIIMGRWNRDTKASLNGVPIDGIWDRLRTKIILHLKELYTIKEILRAESLYWYHRWIKIDR